MQNRPRNVFPFHGYTINYRNVSNVNRLLQSRVYTGDFDLERQNLSRQSRAADFNRAIERVQEILEGRYSTKEKITKHELHSQVLCIVGTAAAPS